MRRQKLISVPGTKAVEGGKLCRVCGAYVLRVNFGLGYTEIA